MFVRKSHVMAKEISVTDQFPWKIPESCYGFPVCIHGTSEMISPFQAEHCRESKC